MYDEQAKGCTDQKKNEHAAELIFRWTRSKDKQAEVWTSSGTDWYRDEHSSVKKVVCIIAPVECYSGYRYCQQEQSIPMINAQIQFI